MNAYFKIISASAPHIYHSALPSSPRTSMIWKLYGSHAQPFIRVVHGVPSSWDSNATATALPDAIEFAVWLPSSRSIAIANDKPFVVDILDSATLHRLQRLWISPGLAEYPRALIFSPDCRMLSCASCDSQGGFVSTWDLQTGGLASRVALPSSGEGWWLEDGCITYSMNGKTVGVLCRHYFCR